MDEDNTHAGVVRVDCEVCNNRVNGSWGPSFPPNAHHCDRCHTTWWGGRISHCRGCCLNFTSQDLSDYHIKDGPNETVIHLNPATVRDSHGKRVFEYYTNYDGHNTGTWSYPGQDPAVFNERARLLAAKGRESKRLRAAERSDVTSPNPTTPPPS